VVLNKIGLQGINSINDISPENFQDIALAIFNYQYRENLVYRQFADALHRQPGNVQSLEAIPFLPISFFKSHKVITGGDAPTLIFESSGTTGEVTSKHYVTDEAIYRASLLHGFKQFYGDPKDYVIIALLPSYLERKNASLVHMAKVLMEESPHPDNDFYLNEWDKLVGTLQSLEARKRPVLLLGVTFALLDFAESHPLKLEHTIVMETGGMKGRREEWTRAQVHAYLKQQWGAASIHSEYGMTELLSQAYSKRDGIFMPSSTMKVLVRDINDPLDVSSSGAGCLNIIDLANVNSCSFIATEDIGNISRDGSFEVLGRMDHSALRGCSLMTA